MHVSVSTLLHFDFKKYTKQNLIFLKTFKSRFIHVHVVTIYVKVFIWLIWKNFNRTQHSDTSIKKIKTLPLKHPMQRSEQMRNGMNLLLNETYDNRVVYILPILYFKK